MKRPIARAVTFCHNVFSRGSRKTKNLKALSGRHGFFMESLESRMLLSVDLVGIPDWIPEGPQPILDAPSVSAAPGDAAGGAVQSVAVNPNNAQQIYVGTVNGGIWRSDNADPANPDDVTWTPLTDQLASLAIGSIEFSSLDPTGNTLYAGTGSFSNLTWSGPPPTAIGILRTTDGGATWSNFAVNSLNEGRIKTVLPTGVDLDPGAGIQEMILVASIDGGAGLYRSNDNGQTFNLLSGANGLPAGAVSQLIVDPNNAQRYYAAVPGQGVYSGAFNAGTGVIAWTQVNGTGPNNLTNVFTSANIQIAAHSDGTNTVLYAGLANAVTGGTVNATLTGVFRSTDAGANWFALGVPAVFNAFSVSGSGFAMIADGNPANNQVVYIGGLSDGDNVYRYDPTVPGWVLIVGAGAQGATQPHADPRDYAFIGNNILVEVDDGGVYFLENPTDALNNSWQSLNGETMNGDALGAIEIHNIAWDSISDIMIAGAQDNGTFVQQMTDSRIWDGILGGDGGDVLVDAFTLAGANQSIRYFSSQRLGIGNMDPQGNFRRQVYDAMNATVGGAVEVLPAAGLANFAAQFVNPIEINAIAPTAAQLMAGQSTRVVVGGGGTSPVYESNDAGVAANPTWTAVPVGAGFGTVTALAYGGRSGGVDNPDVLYAGDSNGRVFVRTVAGGTLNATATPFPGASVSDIALDPNDWRHAFVASSSGVWETTDAGATWIPRTGNLSNNIIQTIEYVDLGANDVVLAGGLGGVFRMITGSPGIWTEYGRFIPNAVTYDLDYNPADDVLIAGLFGRGAWEVPGASDTLAVPGVLQVFGDEDFFGQDDIILLIRQEANPSMLDVFINGSPTISVQISVLQQINVYGFGGNDTLIVDSTNGLINVPLGIRYDGGDGFDELQLLQTGGPVHNTDTYSVGPAIGSGVSTIVGAGMAGTQTVFFEDLEPVLDLVPVALLTINGTATDNEINYTGLVTTGFVTIDEHESIEFANKTHLVIEAGSGKDTVGVNSPLTPTGLADITIDGGDPADGDALIVTGVGVAATVNTVASTITGATGAAGAVTINYSTIESLSVTAVGDLTVTTTGADDIATVTPGLSTGANSGTVQSSGAVPQISFVNSGTFTANLGAGEDELIVNGSTDPDTIAVSGVAVGITGRRTVNASGAESVRVNGRTGSDTFNVTPSASVGIFIDGGDPVGATPGDLLNILAGGGMVTYNTGPETDEGSFVVGANQPVSFDHIESFGITGGGPVVINGTNGPDAITVIARDASSHAGADGVQDFTVSVNTGPELLFINVASLTINALSGSDQVTLLTPAPNNAVWDVDVTVNGGPPAADTDRLIVQTPGAGAETAVYTPGAFDGGTLNLTSLSSLVTINSTENLSYDGHGDNDTLTIVGTGGDDVIVHNPGTNNQAGSIQVNSLLALGYQNVGPGASLTVDGSGGADTLVVNGTAANDSFTVGDAGQVNLNSRVPINVDFIETLTLEGFDGNDSFTLVPAISASVYTTMNFNGGAQASATGDVVNLIATAGNDEILVSGQTVSLGANTVQSSGIEDIRLDALAGDDLLTYNGVSGITENITVGSSGIAGGGQISVPGVTLVDFSGVERVDVHGNAPTPTETDTLTFAGTNAVDVFQINLAADGTDADPILKLETSSASLLLTLRNYTNFETLNVLGLDGEDTFNVTVDGTGPSRNLFVDGGTPQGKKRSTDNLNIFYVSPRPRIIHSAATQDPDAGLVDLDYDPFEFLIEYDGIEQVVIRKA